MLETGKQIPEINILFTQDLSKTEDENSNYDISTLLQNLGQT